MTVLILTILLHLLCFLVTPQHDSSASLRGPPVLTVGLVVERHQLDAVQPVEQGVGVGGVDPGGRRVRPEQLARRVLDQLLRVAAAQALGGVLVDGRDVVTLGRADDGAEGGGGGEDRRGLLLLPAQPLSAAWWLGKIKHAHKSVPLRRENQRRP